MVIYFHFKAFDKLCKGVKNIIGKLWLKQTFFNSGRLSRCRLIYTPSDGFASVFKKDGTRLVSVSKLCGCRNNPLNVAYTRQSFIYFALFEPELFGVGQIFELTARAFS